MEEEIITQNFRKINFKFRRLSWMTLEEFEKSEVVKKKGYSFEVESDYHDWDSTLDAMGTLQKDMEDLCQRDQ